MININIEYNCDNEQIERYLNRLSQKNISLKNVQLKRKGDTVGFKIDTVLTLDSVNITIPNSDIVLVVESYFFLINLEKKILLPGNSYF